MSTSKQLAASIAAFILLCLTGLLLAQSGHAESFSSSKSQPLGTLVTTDFSLVTGMTCTGADWIRKAPSTEPALPDADKTLTCNQGGPIGPFGILNFNKENYRWAACLQKQGEARRCSVNTDTLTGYGSAGDSVLSVIPCLPDGKYVYSWFAEFNPATERFNGHLIDQSSFVVANSSGASLKCQLWLRKLNSLPSHLPKFQANGPRAKAIRSQEK